MLHAGLDLSRKKVDVCLLSEHGEHLDQLAVPPDVDSLRRLARRIEEVHRQPVCAVIESMSGARIIHDTLEQEGWSVEIADAQKVKGLAPLACKTDKIDSQVLATLSHRDLVPAIWLPDPRVREERELARFRLHLVKHKSALKCRIHSTLVNFGVPCPVTDLFGVEGRELLARLEVPEPWRGNVTASLALIDDLERRIEAVNRKLREGHADHPYIPLLMSVPGIRWVLAFTIAAEIGEIERFSSPEKLAGYTGLCPRVDQSGDKDRRGPLTKHGPAYCAGPCSRRRCTRSDTPPTPSATSEPSQLDLARERVEWRTLLDSGEALFVNLDAATGDGDGAYFACHNDDLHAVGSLAPLIEGAIGLIAIKPDHTRQLRPRPTPIRWRRSPTTRPPCTGPAEQRGQQPISSSRSEDGDCRAAGRSSPSRAGASGRRGGATRTGCGA
jgi:transposase